MNKLYGDYPHAWGRCKSVDQSPADYSCAIQRTGGTHTRGDIAVLWAVRFGFVAVIVILVMERL